MSHLLLVDDERKLTDPLKDSFERAGYVVSVAHDGHAGLSLALVEKPDVIILDVMMPGLDGWQVCQAIRQHSTVPIIMLTALDDTIDRIKGLDFGADDYLVKPFDVNELLARLRAVIRRQGGQAANVLSSGNVSLDPATRRARYEDSEALLSAREFALLHALLLHPGAILTRAQLEEHIYGWNEEVESNAVDFLIHGIRRKLGANVINNVRGAGWMIKNTS